jgi:probable addiction module antidote protein
MYETSENRQYGDPAEYPRNRGQITAYLDDVFKSGDPNLIITAIGDVARARGMSKIAMIPSEGGKPVTNHPQQGGNPSFETISRCLLLWGSAYVLLQHRVSLIAVRAKMISAMEGIMDRYVYPATV